MPLSNAEKSKRYRERHPDRFRESLKKYWGKKYNCPCGKTLTIKNKSVHLKTQEHATMMEYQQMKQRIHYLESKETKVKIEDCNTEEENDIEETFINNYLSTAKYDKDGLLITTDSETD